MVNKLHPTPNFIQIYKNNFEIQIILKVFCDVRY